MYFFSVKVLIQHVFLVAINPDKALEDFQVISVRISLPQSLRIRNRFGVLLVVYFSFMMNSDVMYMSRFFPPEFQGKDFDCCSLHEALGSAVLRLYFEFGPEP